MAEGLFFLMIGLVCALTIILLFCEYSCRGDKTSAQLLDEQEGCEKHKDNAEKNVISTIDNNMNEEEEDTFDDASMAMQDSNRKVSVPNLPGRRSSIKVLVSRKESTTSAPLMV